MPPASGCINFSDGFQYFSPRSPAKCEMVKGIGVLFAVSAFSRNPAKAVQFRSLCVSNKPIEPNQSLSIIICFYKKVCGSTEDFKRNSSADLN